MAVPTELRVLCHRLGTVPPPQLLSNLGQLQNCVLKCGTVFATEDASSNRTDASEAQVLVHKLKTSISTLVHGKTPGSRLVAVVLIKSLVQVGGWEILKGCESWVRGLLAILVKPDSAGAKRLCILSITTIYTATHAYQNLVREITTPTLPTYITSCMNLISRKPAAKQTPADPSLVEAVFSSFAMLLTRHPAIFRPFMSSIRTAAHLCAAPTWQDDVVVPQSLREAAARLIISCHQTAAKGSAAEEWAASVRVLVKDIHGTMDQVFRAVVEDWESLTGYVSQPIDLNRPPQGGSTQQGLFPAWDGVDAGIQRLDGQLALLCEYMKQPTVVAVTAPLLHIQDMLSRALSIAPPSTNKASRGLRLHPAVDRAERESLWVGLSRIHASALHLYRVLSSRLQLNFVPLAMTCIDQVLWVFPFCSMDLAFRLSAYKLLVDVLPLTKSALQKATLDRIAPIISACAKDCVTQRAENSSSHLNGSSGMQQVVGGPSQSEGSSSHSANLLLDDSRHVSTSSYGHSDMLPAARALLAVLITHLPTQHLDAYLRGVMDQTAVMSRDEDAMLASVQNPYVAKNGKSLPSLLPFLLGNGQGDSSLAADALVRPRFAPIPHGPAADPLSLPFPHDELGSEAEDEEEDMNGVNGRLHAELISVEDVPMVDGTLETAESHPDRQHHNNDQDHVSEALPGGATSQPNDPATSDDAIPRQKPHIWDTPTTSMSFHAEGEPLQTMDAPIIPAISTSLADTASVDQTSLAVTAALSHTQEEDGSESDESSVHIDGNLSDLEDE